MLRKKAQGYLARCLEAVIIVSVIIVVWLVMLSPVILYFLLPNTYQEMLSDRNGTNATKKFSCQKLLNLTASVLVCQDDFFVDSSHDQLAYNSYYDDVVCKPRCNSWTMFSQPAETISQAIIGTSAVIGALTTVVVIILSFSLFKNMLEFPSVLIVYQDILISTYGCNALLGIMDRKLFCNSEDLIEAYKSVASPYCTISGIITIPLMLPIAIWIMIQVGYIHLGVRFPVIFQRITVNKRRRHILHIISLFIGILSHAIPSVIILCLGGFGLLDSRFPPLVCVARNRDIVTYTIILPLCIITATIITILVLILHQLLRNRYIKKVSNKDLKKVEVKIFIICCCYTILALAALLTYAITSASLDELQQELSIYFECESCGVTSGQLCDRSRFERFTSPSLATFGDSVLVLYPVITLIYVFRPTKRCSHCMQY